MNRRHLQIAFWLFFTGLSGSLAAFSGLFLYLSPKLPAVETLRQVKLQTPLRLYSQDGELVGEFGEKRREPITFEQAPPLMLKAILAAEDDRFYRHNGVDLKGLLRAASQILQSGKIQGGGSTITMQVARNFFLTRAQKFSRKLNEILLALQIERKLNKQEILELYINKIYLGNRAYGIQAASQVYYGKNIDQLSLAQQAMIAGLPKAPARFNPIINPARSLVRRNWILGRMRDLGYIDEFSYNDAVAEPVSASYHGTVKDLDAPYVAEMARKELLDILGDGVYTDGYQVTLTIDSQLQRSAQKAVIEGLITYDQRHGYRGIERRLEPLDDEILLEFEQFQQEQAAAAAETPTEEEATPLDTLIPSLVAEEAPEEPSFDALSSMSAWIDALKDAPTVADLKPAAVISVNEDSLTTLLADGNIEVLAWEQGLNKVRPYISEDRLGPVPEAATDVWQHGDVVRLRQVGGVWYLSQVPEAQAALISLDPDNGSIRALVGGFDFHQSHFNRVTQAARQPGSSFKPFIYTAALENGFTPSTIVNDAPIVFDDQNLETAWRPENDGGNFLGPTRLREALYRSRNLVSIRVLRSIGAGNAIAQMDRYGFNPRELPNDLSLALGSYALTPLEVATGYAVFANGGYKIDPFLISKIEDLEGNLLFSARPATVCLDCPEPIDIASEPNETNGVLDSETPGDQLPEDVSDQAIAADTAITAEEPASEDVIDSENTEAQQEGAVAEATLDATNLLEEPLPIAPRVLDKQVAYIMNSMLQDVVQKGTGRKARVLGRKDLAGKTGTTNGPRDAWFSGYSRHIVTTTWVGFDQNTPLGRREYGGSAALPIWIDYMRTALKGTPEYTPVQPDGLVTIKIDPKTGQRASADQFDAIFEIFRQENAPDLADLTENPLGEDNEESPPEELF